MSLHWTVVLCNFDISLFLRFFGPWCCWFACLFVWNLELKSFFSTALFVDFLQCRNFRIPPPGPNPLWACTDRFLFRAVRHGLKTRTTCTAQRATQCVLDCAMAPVAHGNDHFCGVRFRCYPSRRAEVCRAQAAQPRWNRGEWNIQKQQNCTRKKHRQA